MKENTVNLVELTEVEVNKNESRNQLLTKNMDLINDLPIELHAEIGEFTTTVQELYELKEGEIIKFDSKVDEPIKIFLGDKMVAKGSLVAVDDSYGIEITDIAEITI